MKIDKWLESMSVPSHAPGTRVHSKQWPLMMNGVRFASGYVALMPDRELPIDFRARGQVPPSVYRKSLQVSSVSPSPRWRSGSPLPRARLVASARESRQVLDDMKDLDVARVALVSERVELEEAPPGRALIVHEHPGEIRVETRGVSRQLLVLAESHHAGWRASIDGERCTIVRVYGDYMGCVVPAGEHAVVFVFDPASYRWGRNISWLGLALTAFAPAYFVFRGGRWSGQEDEGS